MEQTIERIPEEIRGLIREVNEKEIFIRRFKRRRGVVIKIAQKLYLIDDPSIDMLNTLKILFNDTLCARCEICRNGELCTKVADRAKEYTKRIELSPIDAIRESKRLEKYPFVLQGIEAFNYPMGDEFLLVLECKNFKKFHVDGRTTRWESTWSNSGIGMEKNF